MGIKVDRQQGQNYADNIIDSLLGFNDTQTWSGIGGTGLAELDVDVLFQGNSSLKIENTDPTNDFVITNSVQSTIINYPSKYGFSLYIRKDEVDEFMTLEVKIFKDAVLFDTQLFVLGSETTEDDLLDNDVWWRFMSDTDYSFGKGDDITFTFNLKGKAGTSLISTIINIDGLFLYDNERRNSMPPNYSPSIKISSIGKKEMFGVYDYNDLTTVSSPISLVLADTQYELTNDGAGVFTNKTYALSTVTDIWNVATNRFDFSGLELGDTVDIRFDVEITTSSVNTAVSMYIELGEGGAPYQLPLIPSSNFKTAGTYELIRWFGIYMGDSNTLDNPSRLLMSSDSTGVTVKVNGWYIRPSKRFI